jgi:4-amino-4-deoxy-L-arabinose transferase-like glycosyltransferase
LDLNTNVPHALWSFLKLISGFAWPALPLALWTLWSRRQQLAAPAQLLPLAFLLLTLLMLALAYKPREVPALLLLPPLALLATPGALILRRGAANAFDWFGMMTFTLLAGLVWLGWLAITFGIPAQIARNIKRLEPGFVATFSPLAFAVAFGISVLWLWLIFTSPRSPQRGATHWTAGVTLCWGLLMALWLPVLNYDRSYHAVGMELKAALPPGHGCITGRGLSNTQRAAFDYFAGIRTVREGSSATPCRLYLTQQGTARIESLPPGADWHKIWEGGRPSDRNERFRLYARP